MKINLEKEIHRENEVFFSFLLHIKSNRIILFISVWENPNMHVISLFKATSIYFTKVINTPFVN